MFKLVPIEKRLCQLGSSYDIIGNACGIKKIKDNIFNLSNLSKLYNDPYVYLIFVILIGILGMIYNIYKLKQLYFSKKINPPSRWHNMSFFSVPPPLAKKCDLLKTFLQINAWGLLLYAAIFKSPLLMYPWLLAQWLQIILKVIAVSINYISRSFTGSTFSTTLKLSFHALTTWIVHKAMVVLLTSQEEPLSDYWDY